VESAHACGVCRTDLHLVDGALTPPKRPLVQGHEIIGTVAALGEEVAASRRNLSVQAPALRLGHRRRLRRLRHCRPALLLSDPDQVQRDRSSAAHVRRFVGYRARRLAGEAERVELNGFGAAAHIILAEAEAPGRRRISGDGRGSTMAARRVSAARRPKKLRRGSATAGSRVQQALVSWIQ
jgi:alcohol dehydrogenase, propanol-preferring